MSDKQLIEYCEKLCEGKGLFAGDRVNRMIELAGNPKCFEPVAKGRMHAMRDEMLHLVGLAKKRMARPAGGLQIEVGRSYRGVNGDVRKVIDMPPQHRSFYVVWPDGAEKRNTRLEAFQEWALEELTV